MDSMDMSHDHSSSNNDYIMHMTFYAGHKALILFDQWKTSTWLSYALSLLGLFLLSVVYQWLQSHINQFSRGCVSLRACHLLRRLLWSFEYMVAIAIAYILMIVVMTFNAGLFVVIVLGFGIGHFLFNSSSPAAPSADAPTIKPAPTCCV